VFGLRRKKPAAPSAPRRLEMIAGGETVAVELTFDRYSSLRIAVRPEGIVRVRAPYGADMAFVRERLEIRAEWIAGHLRRFRDMRPVRALAYAQGEAHALLGHEYRLDLRQSGPGVRPGVRVEGGLLVVALRNPAPDRVRKALDAWYLAQAREVFIQTIRALLPRFDALGVNRPTALKVRAMTSRWGTCSRAGVITLNRHLVRAPLCCVEFVAAHELCHLRHFGHGADFKALLAAVLPDWKERRALLRRELVL